MTISVIVPAYNVEKYIKKCVESILSQTYKDIELILVDDGSKDQTGKICDMYADRDSRVKVVHKINTGVSDSRNQGVIQSIGDYICFIDADDWIEEDYFESVINELKKNYSILFNSWVKEIKGKIEFPYQSLEKSLMDKEYALRELCLQEKFGWAPFATFYRKDIAQKSRFPTDICFGEDLWYKYESIKESDGHLIYIPISKYHYICHNSSATQSYSILKKKDDLKVIKNIIYKEDEIIRDILYYREYIPRMINYALIGFTSDDKEEVSQSKFYRAKLLEKFTKIFFLGKLDKNSTIKLLLLFLPEKMRINLGIKYKKKKGFL